MAEQVNRLYDSFNVPKTANTIPPRPTAQPVAMPPFKPRAVRPPGHRLSNSPPATATPYITNVVKAPSGAPDDEHVAKRARLDLPGPGPGMSSGLGPVPGSSTSKLNNHSRSAVTNPYKKKPHSSALPPPSPAPEDGRPPAPPAQSAAVQAPSQAYQPHSQSPAAPSATLAPVLAPSGSWTPARAQIKIAFGKPKTALVTESPPPPAPPTSQPAPAPPPPALPPPPPPPPAADPPPPPPPHSFGGAVPAQLRPSRFDIGVSTSFAAPPPPPSSAFPPAPAPAPPVAAPIAPAPTLPPFYYKPPGTKDYRVTYDPELDRAPEKRHKHQQRRVDGQGLHYQPTDPRRRGTRPPFLEAKRGFKAELSAVSYAWDERSVGRPPPPPPMAVLVSGFPQTVNLKQLHTELSRFGKVDKFEPQWDKTTGGSLCMAWVKFADTVPLVGSGVRARPPYGAEVQDGSAVAREAVRKGNGLRVGQQMLNSVDGLKVLMDGERKLCRAAVEAEMKRRHPPRPPPPPPRLAPHSNTSSAPPPSSAYGRPALTTRPTPPQPHPLALRHPPPKPTSEMPPSAHPYAPPPTPSHASTSSAYTRNGSWSEEHDSRTRPAPSPSHQPGRALPPAPGVPGLPPKPGAVAGLSARPSAPVVAAAPTPVTPAATIRMLPGETMLMAMRRAREHEADLTRPGRLPAKSTPADDVDMEPETESEEDEEQAQKVFIHTKARPGPKPAGMAVAVLDEPARLAEALVANGHAFIAIYKATFELGRGKGAKLEGAEVTSFFDGVPINRVLENEKGWYVLPNGVYGAERAMKLDRNRFKGHPLELVQHTALDRGDALPAAARPTPKLAPKTSWTDAELVDEAEKLVVGQLMAAFKEDLKREVITPVVKEHLAKHEQLKKAGALKSFNGAGAVAGVAGVALGSLAGMRSFVKKRAAGSAPAKRAKAPKPVPAPRTESEGSSESEREETAPAARRIKLGRRRPSSASEDDRRGPTQAVAHKEQNKPKKRVIHDFTSSDEDDINPRVKAGAGADAMADDDAPERVALSVRLTADGEPPVLLDARLDPDDGSLLDGVRIRSASASVSPVEAVSTKVGKGGRKSIAGSQADGRGNQADRAFIEPSPELNGPGRSASPPPVTRARSPSPDPFKQGIAHDEEDLFYLRLVLERAKRGKPTHPTPPPSDSEADETDASRANARHPSGCARTEGFYSISVAEKMANRPLSNRAKASLEEASKGGASGVAASRNARANQRGLARGVELHKKVTATDTDILKFNQLRTRKKQLTFSRSGIEGYGLFAMEYIPVGDMVIEYVGELIRQQVADKREKAYERQGIGSSYLFRVDEDLVVDATKKGNLGRLINHCCTPNCTAKIITINGEKKIVIYAKAAIEPGDEVTYDYHFPIEEDKIACLCGSPGCRGSLN